MNICLNSHKPFKLDTPVIWSDLNFISRVTLGKSLHLSGPQFPHQLVGEEWGLHREVVVRMGMMEAKAPCSIPWTILTIATPFICFRAQIMRERHHF